MGTFRACGRPILMCKSVCRVSTEWCKVDKGLGLGQVGNENSSARASTPVSLNLYLMYFSICIFAGHKLSSHLIIWSIGGAAKSTIVSAGKRRVH